LRRCQIRETIPDRRRSKPVGSAGAAHPEKARLAKLRYFAGLTIEQAAEAMGVSVPTANRHWAFARVWLYHHVSAVVTLPSPPAPPGAT
jgi:hypothetical protein